MSGETGQVFAPLRATLDLGLDRNIQTSQGRVAKTSLRRGRVQLRRAASTFVMMILRWLRSEGLPLDTPTEGAMLSARKNRLVNQKLA